MTTFTEGRHTAEFLISEANGHRSRSTGTVVAGSAPGLQPGTVLGKVTSSGNYVILAPGASDGSQTAAAILFESAVGTVVRTLIDTDAEVKGSALIWPSGSNAGQKTTALGQLAALGIKVR